MERWPSAIRIEPYQTAFRCPSQLSASQPPGRAARYMVPAKIPTMADAFSRASPIPPTFPHFGEKQRTKRVRMTKKEECITSPRMSAAFNAAESVLAFYT
ncbi:hypothetical protein RF11_03165 [Thelohanellus kitauei]|uniref:Uncharacterized protein n=1 Tax=Thelohanellus kitauei TaxID=669202 RepID=A0A0C2IUA2_THEKT|nr:hypothetical protein RF11_03165 [Thelohanellus kitauei]